MGSGTQPSTLAFGGGATGVANTEAWNGSSWTELADLATARKSIGATGVDSTSALAFGGNAPPNTITGVTEEWTAPSTFSKINLGQVYYNSGSNAFKVTRIVTVTGTWASGGTVNTGRGHGGGAGNSNSANLFFGGQSPGNTTVALTENYNGTAWTEVGDLNQAQHYISGTGSSTAAIVAGGNRSSTPGGDNSVNAEQWDGSSWTEIANLNVGRNGVALFGTSTSAIGASGYSPAVSPNYATNVEQWNGSAWTEIAEVNYGKYGAAAAGTSVLAGLVFGGENSGMPAQQKNTELWNGSSWTETGDMGTTRSWIWSGGTSTDALVSGGQPGSVNTEKFNGTSWTEVNNLATAREYAGGKCGTDTSSCMWVSGAATSPPTGKVTASEEWSEPSSQLNQTITVS